MPARLPVPPPTGRTPLTRDRVLDAALALADRDGLAALTMRRLADELGVEAMSIYHHLPRKDSILAGVVDRVFAEILTEVSHEERLPGSQEAVDPGSGWQAALRTRILAARRVMLRHPWAPELVESRSAPGLSMARYTDGSVALLREGGLSYDLIHHATHALGSRLYGFSQELRSDGGGSDAAAAELGEVLAHMPHVSAMLAEVAHDDPGSTLGWCDDQTEFEFGLDLLLEGLARRHADGHSRT